MHGDVQGVSLRDFTRSRAKELSLLGTVQNLPDGTVEICAEGNEADVRALITSVRTEHSFARITRIEEVWSEATGAFTGFNILKS